ncbi:MAG: DegT/DnrJ/EryC1/StrS family aminotransferase [Rufibacter sp.]
MSFKIPLMRNAFLREKETKEALANFILQADRLSMDQKCVEFERAFAEKQGRADAVLFNSGGSANLAILQALKNLGKLKDGDAIGFSALTWSTNTMPILQLGMQPVALDCEIHTLNVSSGNLLERLQQIELKALFLTNVLGFTSDIAEIKKICDQKNIILLEDNCESLGTELPEGKAGNFGLASSFSFFVAHHMSTIEGGMVCTDDEEFGEMLRIVRANGWDRNLTPAQQQKWRNTFGIETEFQAKYTFYDLGYNLRPTEITGFLGLYQLQFLDSNIEKREQNYLSIEPIIQDNPDLITLAHTHITTLSTFAFPIVCQSTSLRAHYLEKCQQAGIEIRPMIAGNMQHQPFYHKYVQTIFETPNTDFLHTNGFYFGNYPELTPQDLDIIAACLTKNR